MDEATFTAAFNESIAKPEHIDEIGIVDIALVHEDLIDQLNCPRGSEEYSTFLTYFNKAKIALAESELNN